MSIRIPNLRKVPVVDEYDFNVISPLTRQAFAKLSAYELCSVQPMNAPLGITFYMDIKFPDNKTSVAQYISSTEAVDNDVLG